MIMALYTNFGRLLKICDIILPIDFLTCFPILSNQVRSGTNYPRAGAREALFGRSHLCLIVLGEGKESIDKLINLPKNSRPNHIDQNFRNSLGLNGHRIDLTDFSLKRCKKQVSDQVEKNVISYMLEKTGWNRSKACKILKVSYKTLLARIQDLELKPPENFV